MARLRAGGLTFEEIARIFGVTKQRVGRILRDSAATKTALRCCACRAVVVSEVSQVPRGAPLLCSACLATTPGIPFAERVRTRRLVAGLTQEELARRTGLTDQAISLYERGMRRPGARTLARLVEVLGPGLIDGA